MNNKLLKELPNILLIIAMLLGGYLVYPYMPDKIPSHWDFNGNINGYSGKFAGTFSMPLITLGIYLMLLILPIIDPRRENYTKFATVYQKLKLTMVLFFALLYGATLLASLGYLSDMSRAIMFIVSALFLLLGNYFGKIRQNYFVGLRFPWTLADEEVWNKTHRLGGRLWVLSGGLGLVSVFLPGSLAKGLFFGALIISTLVTVIYSYIIYQNKKKLIG